MTRVVFAAFVLAVCITCAVRLHPQARPADDKPVRFDVNDISILWPAPKTKKDVGALIAVDEKLADGVSFILPQKAFDTLLGAARDASVVDSAGRANKMKLADAFSDRSIWKIAGIRVDPSAPGTAPMLIAARGSVPQVRLVVQPVTVKDDTVQVNDVTAHLVFNYVKGFRNAPGGPIAIPDEDKFKTIVQDLVTLKQDLNKLGVTTEGKLAVHPGLTNEKAKDFAEKVKGFLKKHLSEDRLGAMAFMGIDPPEPWIFVALTRKADGTFAVAPNASFGGKSAQMLIQRGGTPVMPLPTTANLDTKKGVKGVSTALLFPDPPAAKLDAAVFADVPEFKHKDIPDFIANPERAHFFNTDCVSCHSESSRRGILKIAAGTSDFAFKTPAGISGVDSNVLPQNKWNVRNFGWFPSGGMALPTATTRTANEAAASAEFINKKYLAK